MSMVFCGKENLLVWVIHCMREWMWVGRYTKLLGLFCAFLFIRVNNHWPLFYLAIIA